MRAHEKRAEFCQISHGECLRPRHSTQNMADCILNLSEPAGAACDRDTFTKLPDCRRHVSCLARSGGAASIVRVPAVRFCQGEKRDLVAFAKLSCLELASGCWRSASPHSATFRMAPDSRNLDTRPGIRASTAAAPDGDQGPRSPGLSRSSFAPTIAKHKTDAGHHHESFRRHQNSHSRACPVPGRAPPEELTRETGNGPKRPFQLAHLHS